MRVIAIDGGERCGWARVDIAEDGSWSELRHGITPLRDFAMALFERINEYDVVVLEDWRLYPHMSQQFIGSSFPTVQFNGIVKGLCWHHKIKLVVHPASAKKPALASMAKFRPELHELCTRAIAHDDGHDQDALTHLWAFTFKTCNLKSERRPA